MDQLVRFDPALLRRYDVAGPRYTSYPTAVQFDPAFGEAEYRAAAAHSRASGRPLSLYFHLPFCDTVCFYCGCNKVVTKNRARANPYLERLAREVALQAELFGSERTVEQLHWGGGTPTFISHAQMRELMEVTRRHFRLRDDDRGEYGIEVDPREVHAGTLPLLRELGFNRLSMGVQDFDPQVQKAVNRIQAPTQTLGVLEEARRLGFRSINVDLIYGLPHQTVASFGHTLDRVVAMSPDRLSVFNYAHLPELFKTQRQIDADALPSAQTKLDILQLTIDKLTVAGYVYIGMDHFARPDDELAVAQRNGTLYRNFQGYSTHAECDLIGFGITSIGAVQGLAGTPGAGVEVHACYAQNVKTLDEYYERIDAGHLPVFRGIALSADDRLRRDVITGLICHFELAYAPIEAFYGIRFGDYFATELAELSGMVADGLLDVGVSSIQIRPQGRLLIRNICMVFDRYLRESRAQRFSKVI